ncbi:MAG: polysaccharide biosynthesis tyrosine autokinase [Muribaculaceae bacterium]|nr:polysaccharide biosynthesis tyrosine autokinase [Muribaculaceae bacterium]
MAKNSKSNEFIDINGTLRQYKKNWYWFAISLFICGVIGFVVAKRSNPEYGVRSSILISGQDQSMLTSFAGLGDLFGTGAYVQDEVMVISSHKVYRKVVEDLGINAVHTVSNGLLSKYFAYPDFPLTVTAPEELVDTLSAVVLFNVDLDSEGKADISIAGPKDLKYEKEKGVELPHSCHTNYGDFTVVPTEHFETGKSLKTEIRFAGMEPAVELLAKGVTAELADRKSNIIVLGINTENRDYGRDVLNTIMAEYNKVGVEQDRQQGQYTLNFIDQRLELLSQELADAEQRITAYQQSERLIEPTVTTEYEMTRKADLEARLVGSETHLEIIRMTKDFLADSKNAYNLIPGTIDNEGLQNSISKYNELILKLMELKSSAKPNNAAVKLLTEQIDALRGNIITTVDRVYRNAQVVNRDARAELAKAESKLDKVPLQAREYLSLLRQQKIKQEIYLFLSQRREETAMLLANTMPKGVIVDTAYVLIKPLTLPRKVQMLIALMIGLIIPPVLIWIRDKLRTKVVDRADVETRITVPVLGEICVNKTGEALAINETSTTSIAELLRLLRSNLLFVLSDPNDKVVLLTSTKSGEGKSFVAINLAASLAMLKKRVLLVGLDIRKPTLGKYLDLHSEYGMTQYLSNNKLTPEQLVITEPHVAGLDVVLAGPVPPNPTELLNSKRMEDFFEYMREKYDYIIVDTAPVGMVSDTFMLNRIGDATIYVTRANYTTYQDLEFAEGIYDNHRLKKLSLVVNGTQQSKNYGYGYGK